MQEELRLIALLVALAFAVASVSPVLAQPKDPAREVGQGRLACEEGATGYQQRLRRPAEGPPGHRRRVLQEDRGRPAVQAEGELVQKKVVPQGTYDKIKDQIVAKQK
jgi:hypothetical protein